MQERNEIDVVVDQAVPTKETELVLHDEQTRTPMVKITVGEQFCLKGVWFEVSEVAEGQLTMQAQAENALAQRTVAMATPNDQQQINNQLENQVGLPSE